MASHFFLALQVLFFPVIAMTGKKGSKTL